MTENNCDFHQEPGVGNAVNVSQRIEEANVPPEDPKPKNNDNRIDSQELNSTTGEKSEQNLLNSVSIEENELLTLSSEESNSSSIENNEPNLLSDGLMNLALNEENEQGLALCEKNAPNSETSLEIEEKLNYLQDHWLKFSSFFRKVYHTTLDGEKPPDGYECHMDIVKELVANDPHQLFARLEMDLQEFIIEVKLRQMELLNCVHTDEGPHLFLFCLIESYNKLMFAASTLSPLLLQLEIEHLANFKITWRGLNQHLFHKLVFTEPKIQKVLPFCISQLGKMNSELSDFNKRLIRQFLTFDDEMTKIGGKWREAESAIIKYHQENSMLDAKERMMKVNWELIKTQTKAFHDELKSSGLCDNYFSESLKKIKVELENAQDQSICDCCNLSTTQCLINAVPLSLESFMDMKSPKSCSSQCESSCKESDILAHLNADGRKMYSHLHKFKLQQQQQQQQQQQPIMNGVKSPQTSPTTNSLKDNIDSTVSAGDKTVTGSPTRQNSSSITSPIELHKTLLRKQQHQKKLMQMVQSSQPKDIQNKIQKQLQEHQLYLQQQKKIDDLHAHLLQQHPMHMDKEMQKKVHLQMRHKLMQEHKQMEEKFHQQVQHHIQHHQEKPPPILPKSSVISKPGPNQSIPNCNHAKPPFVAKNNHKCTTSAPSLSSDQTVSPNPASAVANAKIPNSISGSMTHKNSTTQTAACSPGQNRPRNHPFPDVVKSASYICPKHSETSKNAPYYHDDHCHSSDNSSDEDCSSERSNSPQRHCDCCYCEVFGSAPVSRNFQETRERLRLILTKKKAKSNPPVSTNEKQAIEQNVVPQPSPVNSPQPPSQGVSKVKKEEVPQDKEAQPVTEYKGDKSIEEILDFIEGNKAGNAKRTAKKMRKRQRQQEEEERRRKAEEAERLRQEEIRRKEEEEKRRMEEERRRQELLKEQNRKKNKKKNSKLNQQINQMLASEQKKNKKNQPLVPANDKNRLAQIQSNKNNVNQKPNVQPKQPNQQTQQPKKGKQEPIQVKQQGKQKGQEKSKTSQQPAKNNSQKKPQQNPQKGGKEDNSGQPQMVTIKRVMQPNSTEPTVTITLRGSTPKEDKVLYTLLNGQMCQVKDEKGKKQAPQGTNNANNKKPVKANVTPNVSITNTYNNYNVPNPQPNTLPKSVPFNKSCSIIGTGVNSITERMERLKLGTHPAPNEPVQKMISAPPTATQPELTTPTAIQINQAVNQLSSRPTFPNNFDLENIKLPPGITITKVDPATVNRKAIQMKQQAAAPPPPQTHVRQTMMPSMGGSSNVIVVDTSDKNNYYQSEEQAINGMKKKRRRRKKDTGENGQNITVSPFGAPNGLPARMGSHNAGVYGNPFMGNDYRNGSPQPAAIIQMNGSMVTIRNPALHHALAGQQMDYHDGTKMSHSDIRNSNLDENTFTSVPEEIENGDVDEYERELEAFKRFCSQSVPAESKPKVNLNLEDIVLKKKGQVIGCS